jgi:hypothetical protein
MKKLILILTLCLSGMIYQTATAQVSFRVNITNQPIWGPSGYDYVEYYYMPDLDVYYYVPRHKFVYLEDGRWISRSNLPRRYGDNNFYNTRKIVINEPRPYLRHQDYRERYASSKEGSNNQSIRDSRETKYFVNKNHPEHSKWRESNRNQGRNKKQRK